MGVENDRFSTIKKNSDTMNPSSSSDGRETPERSAPALHPSNPTEVGRRPRIGAPRLRKLQSKSQTGQPAGGTAGAGARGPGQRAVNATTRRGTSRQMPPTIPADQRELRYVAEDHGAKKKKNISAGAVAGAR